VLILVIPKSRYGGKTLTGKKQLFQGALVATLLCFATFVLAPTASATPIGHLDTANCAGGGVVVTATTIDWTLPVGPPNGCIQTGQGTNITFSGGSLGPGATGSILDLSMGQSFPIANFMTFPGLSFTLAALGPGPSNTNCAGLSLFQSCAAFSGSPFSLQLVPSGTAVSLSANGTVSDTTGTSTWSGAFTTQIAGMTPAQIQSTIANGGSVTSTHSGDFTLTAQVVPEPATISSMLLGAFLVAGGLFRRRKTFRA
jgi:hypothetical protein